MEELKKAFLVTFIVLIVQLLGWHYSNSLALFGDSVHVFSDVLAIAVSLFAVWLATWKRSSRRSFGFHRVEVLAALFNGCLLVVMALFVSYEAITRLNGSHSISSIPMMVTSLIGLAGNLYVVYHLEHEENLSIKSAFLHAAGDALSSIGVLVGSIIILMTGLYIVDIIISLLISAIILFSAYTILRNSISILLESAPYGAPLDKVEKTVLSVKGVKGVHDLHVWRTCSELTFAMMHIEVDKMTVAAARELSNRIEKKLRAEFGINHATIQAEPHGCSCENDSRCNIH